MIQETEAAKESLAALTPPASCAAHHRESLGSLDDALEILRSLKTAMESPEPAALPTFVLRGPPEGRAGPPPALRPDALTRARSHDPGEKRTRGWLEEGGEEAARALTATISTRVSRVIQASLGGTRMPMQDTAFRRSLDLLRSRRFGTFWFASLLSNIGTWLSVLPNLLSL